MGDSDNSSNSGGELGWPAVWALTAGGMVGGGIYTALGVVVAVSGQWAWLSLLISGILAFSTALSYVVLSNKFQESGGAFRYLREINKNKLAGSLSWLLVLGYILTISVYAFAFGHYLSNAIHGGPWLMRLFAIIIVGGLVALNLMGVTKTKMVEIIIVSGNLLALIALAVYGLINWHGIQLNAGIEIRSIWAAPIGAASIFVAYEGFQLLSYEYDEIKSPKKILKPTILSAVAFVIGGYSVNRVGRKRQLVSTLVVASLLLIPVAFLNDLLSVLLLSWIGGFVFGMSFPANTSLILEQAPDYRGTMMSMSTIFVTFGMGLGTALGGIVLILYGWTGLILTFAALQLTAAAIYLFLTKDRCKT